jgi:hypothetical protein
MKNNFPGGCSMHRFATLIGVATLLLISVSAIAQDSSQQPGGGSTASGTTTVRGCLRGSRGNYVLIENKSNLAYVLKGVGNKLNSRLRHEIEVKGRVLPGTVKTGIRPEKGGSNPSDTVHGEDGVPLQIADVEADIRTISNKCKAADQQ